MRSFSRNNPLVDITGVLVSAHHDKQTRLLNYMDTVGNPYHFRVGDVPVSVRFGSDKSLHSVISANGLHGNPGL